MNSTTRIQLVQSLRSAPHAGHPGVMLQLVDSGAVFLIGASEWLILQGCNGSTLTAIKADLRARHSFAFADGELEAFILRSHQSGLLTLDDEMAPVVGSSARRSWRLRLGNPERLIAWLAPPTRILFHPISLGCASAAIAGSWMSWARGAGASIEASAHSLNVWERGLAVLLVVLVVAFVHEFAHALTLHRFGGRVREMGLTTVAFCPCFYCDITDSYLLPHKWQRIAVALSGPFAQAAIGAMASAWLFVSTPAPAFIHFVIACTAIAGLLSIANLFPFARTDGYYVLTELLDMPNLRRVARHLLRSWWTGVPISSGRSRTATWAFWLYGLPSTAFTAWMAIRLLRAVARPWLPVLLASLIAVTVPLAAGPVKGQVVDQLGRPLAGAIVSAVDTVTNRDLPAAMSDSQGEFVLQIPNDWPPVDVQIIAAGTTTAIAARAVPASEAVDLGAVRLTPGRVVEGTVIDDHRLPVSGAEVLVFPADASEPLAPGRAISDATGRFLVANAPLNVRSMAVRAEGFADQVAAGLRTTWILNRGGNVEGRVLAEDGAVVSAATVQVGDRRTTTDDRGRYELAALSPGDAILVARTPSGLIGSARVVIAAGATAVSTIRVRQSAVLSGNVIDLVAGRPLGGARIHIYQGTSFTLGPANVSVTATSDRNGRFTIDGLLPGLYAVETVRLGYTRFNRPEIRLTAGANESLAIALPPEARIAGRVIDERGQPIAGATIAAVHPHPMEQIARMLRSGRMQNEIAVTDRAGRFVFRGLAAGRGLRLEATAPEFATARFGGIDVEAGTTRSDILFTLQRGLPLVGTVVDTGDQPVAGAAVRYLRLADTTGMPVQAPIQERPPVAAYTDASGRFVIAGLASGRYDFGVSASGYSAVYLRGLQIFPSSSSELPRIVLPPSVAISGQLFNSANEPIVGARITDVDLIRGIRTTTSDASGAFVVDGLSEAQLVSLQFDAPGFSTTSRSVRAPIENLKVPMTEETSLRGRVVDGDTSSPIPEFSVERFSRAPGQTTLRFGSSAAVQFRSDDGRFEMERLPAGPASIRVKAAGFRPTELSGLMLPMAEEIVVSMKPGVVVEGRVLDANARRPVANAVVSWREGDRADPAEEMMLALGLGQRTTTTDSNGLFVLSDLPPSRITLSVTHQEYPATRRAIDAANEHRVELVLGVGAEVIGVVVAEGSGPVPGATVTLTGAGEEFSRDAPHSAVTDASGRFRLPHVRPASYSIEARASAGVSPRQAVVVRETERSVEVTLTMTSGTTINGIVSGLRPEQLNQIQVMAHATGYYDSTFTDATGRFSLPHVPSGVVSLEATTSFQDGASVGLNLEIPAASTGGSVDVELAFSGQASATGVVSRGGRPVSGVIVSYSPQDVSIRTRGRGTTDAQGHYEVNGLSDGSYFVLVTGSGVRYQRVAAVAAASTVDIELPLAGLQGTVTSTDGEPVEGAVVLAVSGRERGSADVRRAVSDSSGGYQLTDLDPGHYRVRATKVGFEERLATASVSDAMVPLDLTLTSKPGLRLRFTDAATGAPIAQANVMVIGADGGLAFQATLTLDANGQGLIPALSQGKYVLTAQVTGYAARTLAVALPSVQLQVALDRGGVVELRCCGGQPLRRVRLVDAQGLPQILPSSTIGGWTDVIAPAAMWPNVAEGRYALEISGSDRVAVTVKAGVTTIIELK